MMAQTKKRKLEALAARRVLIESKEKAFEANRRTLPVAELRQALSSLAAELLASAVDHEALQELSEATAMLARALKLEEELEENSSRVAECLLLAGRLDRQSARYDAAHVTLQRAINIATATNQSTLLVSGLVCLCSAD
jgi:tetratricopeptide (TPR) repeat protein